MLAVWYERKLTPLEAFLFFLNNKLFHSDLLGGGGLSANANDII